LRVHFKLCKCKFFTSYAQNMPTLIKYVNQNHMDQKLPVCWILTYSLTPWSRVLLEKLTSFQLVKKFPTFYGIRRFITAFTSACHLSISVCWIQNNIAQSIIT
jgi:hypothetical protein